MRLLDERLGEGDREHPVAQVQAAAAGLDVHDHVAAGQRALDRLLDAVGGVVAFDHRLSGGNAHDDVGEVAPGRLAQAQAAQLDVSPPSARDRALGRGAGLVGRAVHQHVGVDGRRARAAAIRMIAATTSAATESPWWKPALAASRPDEHRRRAEPVGREVPGVRAQRGAVVAAGGEQRDRRAAHVEHQRHADHGELEPVDARRRRRLRSGG